MSRADVAAAILWVGATFYALFGGADFGGGLWDLIAGDAEKGERPRALIQRSLTPVWEANHVWLIFILVVLWTAFPAAFSAVMTTLYVPLALAALGIVLRGAGFAFRKSIERLAGAAGDGRDLRALLGADAVLHGRRGRRDRRRQRPRRAATATPSRAGSQPLPLLTGAMFVATGAYLAAVFLVGDARRAGEAGPRALLRAPRAGRRRRRRGAALGRALRARTPKPATSSTASSTRALPLVILSGALRVGAAGGAAARRPPRRCGRSRPARSSR